MKTIRRCLAANPEATQRSRLDACPNGHSDARRDPGLDVAQGKTLPKLVRAAVVLCGVLATFAATVHAGAPPQTTLHEFDQTAGGGINVADATGTLYSVTWATAAGQPKTYDVWFSVIQPVCDAAGCLFTEVAAGMAGAVGDTRVQASRTGVRLTLQPDDWTVLWVGSAIAVDVVGRDAHTESVTEQVGPRIEVTPCSRRVINGSRYEMNLHAAGTIGNFKFDSTLFEDPHQLPFWYLVAHGETGRIREWRTADCSGDAIVAVQGAPAISRLATAWRIAADRSMTQGPSRRTVTLSAAPAGIL